MYLQSCYQNKFVFILFPREGQNMNRILDVDYYIMTPICCQRQGISTQMFENCIVRGYSVFFTILLTQTRRKSRTSFTKDKIGSIIVGIHTLVKIAIAGLFNCVVPFEVITHIASSLLPLFVRQSTLFTSDKKNFIIGHFILSVYFACIIRITIRMSLAVFKPF